MALYLLSPAGSPESLRAALEAGADEVYLGGPAFNARMNAANFTPEGLKEAGALCRAQNVRLHITVNTLLSDREFASALEYVRFLNEEVCPDALIVQDMGLAAAIRREFPGLALHASTQMRVHSPRDIPFLQKLGFTRAVLARELPARDIKECSASGVETEIFAHGALCVCESGGCLMSSVIGGRSGNRGECAQPCRLPYKGGNGYPLSLKDLCLAGRITDIAECGVTSIKLEGRMKSPDYVYAVTSVYRRLIDENRNAGPAELEKLANIFSRGGFTQGYFDSKINKTMFGFRSESDKQTTRSSAFARGAAYPPRKPVAAPVIPPFLPPVRDDQAVLPARGQFGFVLRFDCALPSERLLSKYAPSAARIDVPLRFAADKRLAPYAGKISAIMPRSVFCAEMTETEKQLDAAKKNGVDQLTVTSVWQFSLAGKGFFLHGDYTLNVTNRQSLAFYAGCPLSSVMLSPETEGTFPKGCPAALEYIVYGRTPLMHTRACIIANLKPCPRESGNEVKSPVCSAVLTDRVGARFPVFAGADHVNTVYNSLPAWRLDRAKELKRSGVGLLTLFFTDESESRAAHMIDLALSGKKPDFEYTRR